MGTDAEYGVAETDCKCGTALIKHGQVCYHKALANTAIQKCKGNGAIATDKCACCTITGSICNIANDGETCSIHGIATPLASCTSTDGTEATIVDCRCGNNKIITSGEICYDDVIFATISLCPHRQP